MSLPIYWSEVNYHTTDPSKKVRVKGKVTDFKREYPKMLTFTCGQTVDEILTHDTILMMRINKTLKKSTEIIHITDVKFKTQHGKTTWI